ncbi:hypothetical protein DICPUDRAFT_85182 [Dictyostelium purpureum]|uniref:Uncharacterized protein n=1 Tax=Dictyostelium purpureum TaxID=5786 RepID=F1A4Y7_DICPU|nr:uncharacterized protein DICPUDRAFT_85182 [Dictyostelium purpureum]EGC28744.1 hypothetical protein DICPUDRAFT_85182 [Dictyostelium purpureum]|eukprot:XP_003294734.1 hypothetical protein DICPUDRAFT_85182 [Dictyostelium purpureum]
MDDLFFKVFKNNYIKNLIFSFLKPTISYDSLYHVPSIIRNNGINIIIDKVKSNQFLKFQSFILSNDKITYLFGDIFQLVNGDDQDFYYKLFQNYTIMGYTDVQDLVFTALKGGCVQILKIINEIYNQELTSEHIEISIRECSIKSLQYLIQDIKVPLPSSGNIINVVKELLLKYDPKSFKLINYLIKNKCLTKEQVDGIGLIKEKLYSINVFQSGFKLKYLVEACNLIGVLYPSKKLSGSFTKEQLGTKVLRVVIENHGNMAIKNQILDLILLYYSVSNIDQREIFLLYGIARYNVGSTQKNFMKICRFGDYLDIGDHIQELCQNLEAAFRTKKKIQLFKYCPSIENQILFIERVCQLFKKIKYEHLFTVGLNPLTFFCMVIEYDSLEYLELTYNLLYQDFKDFFRYPIFLEYVKSTKILGFIFRNFKELFEFPAMNKHIIWKSLDRNNIPLIKHYQELVAADTHKNLDILYYTTPEEAQGYSLAANLVLDEFRERQFRQTEVLAFIMSVELGYIQTENDFQSFIATLSTIDFQTEIYPFDCNFKNFFSEYYFKKILVWIANTQVYRTIESLESPQMLVDGPTEKIRFSWGASEYLLVLYYQGKYDEITTNISNINLLLKNNIQREVEESLSTSFIDALLTSELCYSHENFTNFFYDSILYTSVLYGKFQIINHINGYHNFIFINTYSNQDLEKLLVLSILKGNFEISDTLIQYTSLTEEQIKINSENPYFKIFLQ